MSKKFGPDSPGEPSHLAEQVPDIDLLFESLKSNLMSPDVQVRTRAIAALETAGTAYLVNKSGDNRLSVRIVDDEIINGSYDGTVLWIKIFRDSLERNIASDMLNSDGLDHFLEFYQ